MKLTYEDKLGIYKLRKQGVSWPQLGQTYDVNPRNLRYMVKLMERYGVEIVKKSKNRYYCPELKLPLIHISTELTSLPVWSNSFTFAILTVFSFLII